jgi:hypothetical protein
MARRRLTPGATVDDEQLTPGAHPAADEDSSGNRPPPAQRNDRDTPLEDEHGRSRRGHPGGSENFRGD